MCYFIVGNKIFCFFKKRVFASLDEDTFQGVGAKLSKTLRGVAQKKEGGGGLRDFDFFFWEGLGKKRGRVNISG